MAEAEPASLEAERRAVARAQAGESRALEPVLAAHAEALFGQVILPRVGDRVLAEELLEECFVAAFERIGQFAWQGRSVFFWLRQIALHKIIDHHRRRGRARRFLDELQREAESEPPPGAVVDALIAEEDRRRALARIEAVMAELPERQARAIRLRLIEERSREECARELEMSVPTFDVTLFRAVRAFRKAYGER